MSNKYLRQIAMWVVMLVVFCLPSVTYSESGEQEAIGKLDPFEVVKPMFDAKKAVVSRLSPQTTMIVEEKPEMFVEVAVLTFLKVVNLEPILTNLTSIYGTVAIDESSNTIIVCDNRENVDRIIAEIKRADKTPKQIMIEVVIVDVQLNDETEFGVDWEHLLGGGATFGDLTNSKSNQRSYGQTLIPTDLTTGGTFGLIQNGIKVTLNALQQVRDVEILASPRVMVLSGEEGYIKTVEEIPYKETSDTYAGGSLTSTEFKEAGVTLTVKAVLTDSGKIWLTVEPEQSVNTGVNTVTDSTVPVVDKRSAKSTLLMDDGQVLIMGGLRKKEIRVSENKVPFLGDLPLIGFLFSNEKTEIKHSELMVFISPHIYNDEPLTGGEDAKFRELRSRPHLNLKAETPNNPVDYMSATVE